ncbi:MAG: hypothetical protein A2107_06195 [Verrucomicrobia bacterium GWF2_62_7]|nr:MAG: hypothetical protein A2107_06195 [Verrucomicrobia bacterium GWF2_62_7]
MREFVAFIVLLVALPCYGEGPNDERWTLYTARRWFALRDAVAKVNAPAFYRGAVAWAFHQPGAAEKQLRQAIKLAPGSREAVEAHQMLTTWFSLTGQYRRAFLEYREVQALRPNDKGARAELASLDVWSRYPEPRVRKHRHSQVPCEIKDGDLFVQLSVNGVEARYLIDTGSNASFISESEARRVGMALDTAQGLQSHDASGTSGGYRVAVAKDLILGSVHLTNVAFLVFRDDQLPFVNLPSGWRGALGLPVMLALNTIRWSRAGSFEVGFPSAAYDVAKVNLCFSGDGPHTVVQGGFEHKRIQMVIDTGAMRSRLLPSFAEDFPLLAQENGRRQTGQLHGVHGPRQTETLVLSGVSLRIGNFTFSLRPAELLLDRSPFGKSAYHAWLGQDLLQQARQVTIDFGAMRLSVE